MNSKKLYKTVVAALFAAVICVVTYAIHIPMPSGYGYINIGDAFVLLSGFILGPVYGFLASAIGSGLCDLILGYTVYVPATAVIKGLCALIICLAIRLLPKHKFTAYIIGSVLAETSMVLLYLVYEYFVLHYGASAISNIPMNAIQGVISAVLAVIIIITVDKSKIKDKFMR